jgi:hypothetical protein
MVKTIISSRNNPVVTIGDGRPTWPPDGTAKPSRTEGSTRFCVPSGDLGTHAMHPPRKRRTCLWPSEKQLIIETRGRTRRPSPTRRLNRKDRIQDETTSHRDASTAQAENVFVAIRKAINNRNAREGAAVRPYTEILHPPRKRRTCLWPSEKQLIIETRGRTQRSAPTRNFVHLSNRY